MKKMLAMVIVAFAFISTACSNKLNTYTEISYDKYLSMLEQGESFPLVIGSSTCSACALYKNTVESFIKNNQVEIFYIDLSKVTDEEYDKLKSQISFTGTPTTVFIDNGNLTSFYNRLDGSANYTKLATIFKQNGYVVA